MEHKNVTLIKRILVDLSEKDLIILRSAIIKDFVTTKELAKRFQCTPDRIRELQVSCFGKLSMFNWLDSLSEIKPRTPIEMLGVKTRVVNSLCSELGIRYVEDLVKFTEKNLLDTLGIGKEGVENIKMALKNYNFYLKQ